MNEKLYKIQSVVEKTGVKEVTLRAWERRHGIIKPVRTDSGHRLYTESEIDRIKQIVSLTRQGIPISQVNNYFDKESNNLDPKRAPSDTWSRAIDQLDEAVHRFDTYTLDKIYSELMSIYSIDVVTSQIIIPLQHRLGSRWAECKIGVHHEHFFSVFIRNKIGARYNHLLSQAYGKKIVLCCLPGEQHDLGTLLFGLFIIPRGFHPINLGANAPLEELPLTLSQSGAVAAVLYGVPDEAVKQQYLDLDRQLEVPLFVVTKQGKAEVDSCFRTIDEDFSVAARQLEQALSVTV